MAPMGPLAGGSFQKMAEIPTILRS